MQLLITIQKQDYYLFFENKSADLGNNKTLKGEKTPNCE